MKTKLKYLPFVLYLSIIFLFSYCNSSVDPIYQSGSSEVKSSELTAGDLVTSVNKIGTGSISQLEKDGLIWMREEEKLARDVYITLNTQYNSRVFTNISLSEQKHMNALKNLLDKYRIADPVENDAVGYYTNEYFKTLYNELIESGNLSLVQAFLVGAEIEEIDILDLKKQISLVDDNQDIITVYNNLLLGSYNHLNAFVANLKAQGLTYTPKYLDESTYNSIINIF